MATKPDPSTARKRRSEKARILAQLGSGKRSLCALLGAAPPACLANTELWSVLLRTKGMGEAKAKQTCQDANIWPLLHMSHLTDGQRERLIDALPDYIR